MEPSATIEPPVNRDLMVFIAFGIILPIICCVGVITNIINIVVLSYIAARIRTPTYHILLGVAIADLGLLIIVLAFNIRYNTQIPFLEIADIGVPPNITVDYAAYFFISTWYRMSDYFVMTSNWCIVAVSIFRVVAITFPLHTSTLCTKTKARITVMLVYALSLLIWVPQCFSVVINDAGAFVPSSSSLSDLMIWERYGRAVIVLMHVIPWIISCVCAAVLIYSVRKKSPGFLTTAMSVAQKDQKAREQTKVTTTLIGVVVLFIVCTCPSVVYHLQYSASDWEPVEEGTQAFWTQFFFYTAQYIGICLNHAANFFLYTMLNSNYRRHFIGVLVRTTSLKRWGTFKAYSTKRNVTTSARSTPLVSTPTHGSEIELRGTPKMGAHRHQRLIPNKEQMINYSATGTRPVQSPSSGNVKDVSF